MNMVSEGEEEEIVLILFCVSFLCVYDEHISLMLTHLYH